MDGGYTDKLVLSSTVCLRFVLTVVTVVMLVAGENNVPQSVQFWRWICNVLSRCIKWSNTLSTPHLRC